MTQIEVISNTQQSNTLQSYIKICQNRINRHLELSLNSCSNIAQTLKEAMQYATLQGGKRIRPVLAYAIADTLGCDRRLVDSSATAIELIHCYSLVHDDLPAMDNDELRRGKPTCHIVYDEATAILVGDALQSLAYEVLATQAPEFIKPHTCLQLIRLLSKASGTFGMAAGQMLDLENTNTPTIEASVELLEQIHRLKTGALIQTSVEMAYIACGLQDIQQQTALSEYAQHIGLAFQVQDDILDVTGNTQALGKKARADIDLNKLTYPSLIGLQASKKKAIELVENALSILATFNDKADPLKNIAQLIISRIQ